MRTANSRIPYGSFPPRFTPLNSKLFYNFNVGQRLNNLTWTIAKINQWNFNSHYLIAMAVTNTSLLTRFYLIICKFRSFWLEWNGMLSGSVLQTNIVNQIIIRKPINNCRTQLVFKCQPAIICAHVKNDWKLQGINSHERTIQRRPYPARRWASSSIYC